MASSRPMVAASEGEKAIVRSGINEDISALDKTGQVNRTTAGHFIPLLLY
jgi:hypothetical protein